MIPFLDLCKLNMFGDDKQNIVEIKGNVGENLENIVEKGENAGYQTTPNPFPNNKFQTLLN